MKFLFASLAFCACVCFSAAGIGRGLINTYGPVNSYGVPLGPAAPLNTVIPVYNIPAPAFQPIYSNVPVYGLPAYGNIAGPARASSAAAASSSLQDSSYAAPGAPY